MKTLEKAHDKIQKICTILREETLVPAQKEAQDIIEKAQQQAEEIVRRGELAAKKLHEDARIAIEKEKAVFQSTLKQSAEQSLFALRQAIESKFFNDTLVDELEKSAVSPQFIADLLSAIVKAIQKDGMDADLTGIVARSVQPRQLNELLMKEVLNSLREKSVVLGEFNAGVQVKLNGKKMTIDISDAALRELLATYVTRKDFRKLVFGTA